MQTNHFLWNPTPCSQPHTVLTQTRVLNQHKVWVPLSAILMLPDAMWPQPPFWTQSATSGFSFTHNTHKYTHLCTPVFMNAANLYSIKNFKSFNQLLILQFCFKLLTQLLIIVPDLQLSVFLWDWFIELAVFSLLRRVVPQGIWCRLDVIN